MSSDTLELGVGVVAVTVEMLWGWSSSDDAGGGCRRCCEGLLSSDMLELGVVIIAIAVKMLWGWSSSSDDAGDGMVVMDSTGAGGHQTMLEMGVIIIGRRWN